MASPYEGGGSAAASNYESASSGGNAPAKKAHGASGFASNLLHEAEDTLTSMPSGIKDLALHPVKTVKEMGKSYEQMYSPLIHGHLGQFGHNLYDKPLGPILDALTIATLGAGGAARAGELAGKAGIVADTSRLARLRVAEPLTVPDFAKVAGQEGKDLTVKMSSKNPLIRARQTRINEAMNKLGTNTPLIGSASRAAKVLRNPALRDSQSLAARADPFTKAFAQLSDTEKAAFHVVARGVTPKAWQDLIDAGALASPKGTEATMSKALDSEKLNDTVVNYHEHPKLLHALDEGEKLSETMKHAKVERGMLDEVDAEEAPYRALRQTNGADIIHHVTSPTLTRAVHNVERLKRLHTKALDREEKWHVDTQGGKVPRDLRASMSEEAAHARIAELDKQHEALLQTIVPEIDPYGDAAARQAETSARNITRGKKRKGSAYENATIASSSSLTVKEELRAAADAKLHETFAKHPDHPIVKEHLARIAEREQLRNLLNERGEASMEGRHGKPLPKHGAQPDLPPESNPYRDRIVQIGIQLEAEQAKVERLLKRHRTSGIVDKPGRDIPTLARELDKAGRPQPFYVRDTADSERLPKQTYKPTGTNAPQKLQSQKRNLGTLFAKGMINLKGNPLSREMAQLARHIGRSDINSALMHHAASLGEDEVMPRNYSFLKTVAGQKAANYTDRAAPDLIHSLEDKQSLLDKFTTKDKNHPDVVPDATGSRLIVPDRAAATLAHDAQASHSLTHSILYGHPTSIWKHMVLGLRPAYIVNNTVGNHVLALLGQAPGHHGFSAYFDQLRPGARPGKLTTQTVEDVMPEQAHATFAQSSGFTSNKGLSAAHKAYQGVMPATQSVETWLRKVLIQGWAASMPEVKAAMKLHDGDINIAMHDIAREHPHLIDEISKRVDDSQGDYRNYTPAEQKLRQVIPFYAWDKHVVKSFGRVAAERPGLLDAMTQTGAQGQRSNLREFGTLPDYLKGLVSIGGGHVTTTHGLNPASTIADLLKMVEAVGSGKAGTGAEIAAGINPGLQGLIEQITGRSLLTGAPLKDSLHHGLLNVPARMAMGIPQARLLETLLQGHTFGASKNAPVLSADAKAQLTALLGVPVRDLNRGRAAAVAQLENK